MSDMKCPMCNTNLEVLVGGANALLGCPRCRDKATDGVWQELIRTRKALGVAVDALDAGKTLADIAGFKMLVAGLEEALAKIKTALEQKESAFVHNKIEFPEYNDNLLEEFDKQFFESGQDDDLTETALEQKDK